MTDLLLDTCAVIWTGNGDPIEQEATSRIERCLQSGGKVFVSPFSAWELGALVSRARLRLPISADEWFSQFMYKSRLNLAELSPRTLVASSFLPGTPPKDPADRIVIATARENGLAVVTRDKKILNYAADGHVQAVAC